MKIPKNIQLIISAGGVILILLLLSNLGSKESVIKDKIEYSGDMEIITLAGGCFWCIEAPLQETEGVIDVVSGYSGGLEENANYLEVIQGDTRHRESVQVIYDPSIIKTEEIISIFWNQIDPTDDEGQFADRGYQYTTAIFYHNDNQKKVAEDSLRKLEESGIFDSPIVTEIIEFESFFKAEEYHQDYYKKSSDNYKRYKEGSGRTDFIDSEWAKDAAIKFLKEAKESERGEYEYTEEEIEELLNNLDPLAYHVVSENGTETPFDNAYWDNKAEGIYVDVVSGEPLFSSTHKYDSGTGWPTFWRSIDDESIELLDDNSLSQKRTEVRSNTGHLGHVFDDGPEEYGGNRFCINSASLLFIPKEELEEKGYGEYLKLFIN